MKRSLSRRLAGALVIGLLLGGAALTACGQPGAGGAPVDKGPPAGPAAGDAAKGEELFTSSGCTACHNTTAEQLVGPGLQGVLVGKGPYGDKLPNGKPITDENVVEWIKIGGVGTIGQMPGNPTLTDEQLRDLVAYLHTLE